MERRDLARHASVIGEIRERGDVAQAIEEYMKIFPDAKGILYSQVPQMIGVCYRMMDRPQEALPFAERSVRWAQEARDTEQEANCRRDLGGVYNQLERYEEAEQEYLRSLELLWDNNEGKVNAIAGTFSALAKLHAKKGDFDQAILLGERAFYLTEASVELDSPNAGQHYLFAIHLAEIYKGAGMNDKAISVAKYAWEGAKRLGQKIRVERAEKLLADLNSPTT